MAATAQRFTNTTKQLEAMKRPKDPRMSVSEAGKRLKEISDRLRGQPVPNFHSGGIMIHPSNIETERVIQPSEIPQRNYHIIGACDYPDCSICNPKS